MLQRVLDELKGFDLMSEPDKWLLPFGFGLRDRDSL